MPALWHKSAGEAVLEYFDFQNHAVREALAWRASNPKYFENGYSYSKRGSAYAFIVLCARTAFGIDRRPEYEDQVLKHWIAEYGKPNETFSDQMVSEGAEELLRLWDFTQAKLTSESMVLKRNLSFNFSRRRFNQTQGGKRGYAAGILQDKVNAVRDGLDTVSVEMDTLNGFTADGNRAYGNLQIELSVPKKDILYLSNHVPETETGEFMVLNRSVRGHVSVPVSGIKAFGVKPEAPFAG